MGKKIISKLHLSNETPKALLILKKNIERMRRQKKLTNDF